PTSTHKYAKQNNQHQLRCLDCFVDPSGIAVRYFFKPSIATMMDAVQGLPLGCSFTWTQYQLMAGRCNVRCEKSLTQYRNSNCYRKLLIELTNHSRDKSYWNKHRS